MRHISKKQIAYTGELCKLEDFIWRVIQAESHMKQKGMYGRFLTATKRNLIYTTARHLGTNGLIFKVIKKLINSPSLEMKEVIILSWEVIDSEVLGKIKKQKEFEDQTAEKLTPLYKSAKNPLIKVFLHSIILDTMRHSETYQMLIDLNSSALLGKESEDLGKEKLATHIKEEAIMLKQTQEISEVVKDKRIKQIVLNILEDEKKHHRVLKDLLQILEKESEKWDAYLYDLITGFP